MHLTEEVNRMNKWEGEKKATRETRIRGDGEAKKASEDKDSK